MQSCQRPRISGELSGLRLAVQHFDLLTNEPATLQQGSGFASCADERPFSIFSRNQKQPATLHGFRPTRILFRRLAESYFHNGSRPRAKAHYRRQPVRTLRGENVPSTFIRSITIQARNRRLQALPNSLLPHDHRRMRKALGLRTIPSHNSLANRWQSLEQLFVFEDFTQQRLCSVTDQNHRQSRPRCPSRDNARAFFAQQHRAAARSDPLAMYRNPRSHKDDTLNARNAQHRSIMRNVSSPACFLSATERFHVKSTPRQFFRLALVIELLHLCCAVVATVILREP